MWHLLLIPLRRMRLVLLVPAVCAFIALIISLCCVFAGSSGNLEDTYIISLNTSHIGENFVNDIKNPTALLPTPSATLPKVIASLTSATAAPTKTGGVFGGLFNDAADAAPKDDSTSTTTTTTTAAAATTADSSSDAKDDTALSARSLFHHPGSSNSSDESFAQKIGLHDFYSVYIRNYCEGYFKDPLTNSTSSHTTFCSKGSTFFSFQPSTVLSAELNDHLDLSMLHWPVSIDNALHSLGLAFHVTVVIYCMAIILTGFLLLATAYGLFFSTKLLALVCTSLAAAAILLLIIASAVVTAAAHTATSEINKYGATIDVTAYRGTKLIGLTWTATLLVFVAGLAWAAELLLHRRRARLGGKDFPGMSQI